MNRFYHFRVVPSVLQLSTVVGLRWRLRMLFSFRVFMTPNFLCIIVHEMAFFFCFLFLALSTHCSQTLFFVFFLFPVETPICCSVFWQSFFLHFSLPLSFSILPFHCLFTSLHCSRGITLSPLAMSYSVSRLPPVCLLSASSHLTRFSTITSRQ